LGLLVGRGVAWRAVGRGLVVAWLVCRLLLLVMNKTGTVFFFFWAFPILHL
jgi:hypothetical protein